MKFNRVFQFCLAMGLTLTAPNHALAHAGHGDEFQAEGGIERVQVNADTDSLLGIQVAPIEQAASDGNGVLVPATALVDADDQTFVATDWLDVNECLWAGH